jgi:hypothetical protein
MSKSVKSRVKTTRAYTGDLAEPIYEPVHATADEAAETRISKLIKLRRLFEFYRIEADPKRNWAALALALAEQHVPGFRVVHARPKRGRPRTWKAGLDDDLVRDVASLKGQRKITTADAIKQLQADPSKIWSRYTIPNLVTRHREAQRVIRERRRFASALAESGLIAGLGSIRPRSESGLFAGLGPIPTTTSGSKR